MRKPLFLATMLFFLCVSFQTKAQKIAYTLPEVNTLLKGIHQYIDVELTDSTKQRVGFNSSSYLIPLTNYIDYNVIGKGRVAVINEDMLRDFIIKKIQDGVSLKQISQDLIGQYNVQKNIVTTEGEKSDGFHIGGFFSSEVEYHQEEDGKFQTKLEINQVKLYFASHFNSKSNGNKVDVFAEYNPAPEEVIHQVDEAVVRKGTNVDTINGSTNELPSNHEAYVIPFERLLVAINNVAGTKLNITFGQFRNPFGNWSDYTSHRNFNSVKNNMLVNGFGLKKIETGLKLDYPLSDNWDIEAAIVYGRKGRTYPLYREDQDNEKDFVTHITYTKNRFSFGASAYLAELSFKKRIALGLDFSYQFDKLLVSGEYAYQQNNQVGFNAPNISSFVNKLSSHSAYAQFDYAFSEKFHLFGLYDFWQMNADDQIVNRATYKVFHGLKYFINAKARWTILEYGHMFFEGFNNGQTHLSSQIEINF
jgi:hypothetical protein